MELSALLLTAIHSSSSVSVFKRKQTSSKERLVLARRTGRISCKESVLDVNFYVFIDLANQNTCLRARILL